MASTNGGHGEFQIIDEIGELGFSRVHTMGIILEEEQIGYRCNKKKELQT